MKFLLIQRRSLGDALFTATVAEVLKKEFPDAEVHLLTLPFAVDFFEKYLYLDKVFPYSGFFKTLRELRQRDYDVILDYEATFRTYPLVFFSKAKRKLAFYRNSREARLGFIYTDLVRAENFGFTFWDRLKLLKPLGVDYKKYIDRRFKPSFPTRDLPNVELPFEDYIVFSPKGLLRNKTISPEKVIEIASALERKLSKRVVISVEPREKGYIESLKRQMNKQQREFRVFSEDLTRFLVLIKNSKGLISIESFPYHLALLLNKPSLVVVQGYDIWYRETFGLIEVYKPPLSCVPCFKRDKCPRGDFACTYTLNTEQIVEKAKELFT